MKVDTETFSQIRTAKDLDKAVFNVIAVVDAFCKQVRDSEKVKFAHCEACPFYSWSKDDCLKYFMHNAISEQVEKEEI